MSLSERQLRARRLQGFINHPGWADFVAHVEEESEGILHRAMSLLRNDPKSMTTETAIALSNKVNAIIDLKEWVELEARDAQ